MPLTRDDYDQVDQLVNIIKNEASTFPFSAGGPKAYLNAWIMESKIPSNFKNDLSSGLTGDASIDARIIVLYSINKGINPAEPECTVLGSMLKKLLDKLGLSANQTVSTILNGELDLHPTPPSQPHPQQPTQDTTLIQKPSSPDLWRTLRSKISSPGGIIAIVLLIVGIGYLGSRLFPLAPTKTTTPASPLAVTLRPMETIRLATQITTSFHPVTQVPVTFAPLVTVGKAIPIASLAPTMVYKEQMVLIPAGSFVMGFEGGDGDEKPSHSVILQEYYIDKFEVTNSQYRLCVSGNVCKPPSLFSSSTRSNYFNNPSYDNYPVIYVSWDDARTYCEWFGARLPTEAEWEKAARGGLDGKIYPWGDENPSCDRGAANGANFGGCTSLDTIIVENFGANGYGIYDMAGNVWEWVADWYESSYYNYTPSDNPLGPQSGITKVIRGGRWSSTVGGLRVAGRNNAYPSDSTEYGGFRCASYP